MWAARTGLIPSMYRPIEPKMARARMDVGPGVPLAPAGAASDSTHAATSRATLVVGPESSYFCPFSWTLCSPVWDLVGEGVVGDWNFRRPHVCSWFVCSVCGVFACGFGQTVHADEATSASRVMRVLDTWPAPQDLPASWHQASLLWSIAVGVVGTFSAVEWQTLYDQLLVGVERRVVVEPSTCAVPELSPRGAWMAWIAGVVGPALGVSVPCPVPPSMVRGLGHGCLSPVAFAQGLCSLHFVCR
jgi:hypothetical protein